MDSKHHFQYPKIFIPKIGHDIPKIGDISVGNDIPNIWVTFNYIGHLQTPAQGPEKQNVGYVNPGWVNPAVEG